MIPRKFAPALFGFVLSGLMSLLVSGIATIRIVGIDASFVASWTGAWLSAWAVAFPAVLVVAPLSRRLVERLVASE